MQPTQPIAEITDKNLRTDPNTGVSMYDDAGATQLVLDDYSQGTAFLVQNHWAAAWEQSIILLQSPQSVSSLPGGTFSRPSVPKFTLSNHMSVIVPKMMSAIFFGDPPFMLRPRGSSDQAVIRAKEALFTYQLEDMKFEREVQKGIEQCALLGTAIYKWCWLEKKKKVKKYVVKNKEEKIQGPLMTHTVISEEADQFKIEYDEKDDHRPDFKFVDMRTVVVDRGCREGDITQAKQVIYKAFPTFEELDSLRNYDGYNLPKTAELRAWYMRDKDTPLPDNFTMTLPEGMRGWIQSAQPRNLASTADPLQNGLEMLERWDRDKVITIIRHKGEAFTIRNQSNEYGKIPFFSFNWRNLPDSFYGQGLGLLIGNEQIVAQDINSLALGLASYGLHPQFLRAKGYNTPAQGIRWKQGGILDIDTDDVNKGFGVLEMPQTPPAVFSLLQQSQATAEQTSGANEQVMQGAGAAGIKTTGMRSATGAAAVIGANASRLDYPLEGFIRQVFIPWIYQMNELNNDKLPTQVLRDVLTEKGVQMVSHDKFRNSKMDFEALAGSHLGAKAQMTQYLPFLEQMMNNPSFTQMAADQGKKWNFVAFFEAMTDMAGWKFSQDFLVDMTPQEVQAAAANKPAALQAQKAKDDQDAARAKFEHDEQMQNEKQLGKAGGEIARTVVEKSMDSEALNGTPGNVGFGSSTQI